MKIRIRFIVVQAPDGLPVGADGCSEMEISDGLTVDLALAALALPGDLPYLTLVNEDSIPVAERMHRHLQENDLLTVFSPLKGG